jgi:hypothetical protein
MEIQVGLASGESRVMYGYKVNAISLILREKKENSNS